MLIDEIGPLLQEKLDQDGIELVDCLWTSMGHLKVLQVQIAFTDGSMDLDTCAMVSEYLSARLDEVNLYDFEYSLEVCSPGAERPLKQERDLERALGSMVSVKLKAARDGFDEVLGTLKSIDSEHLTIEIRVKHALKQFIVKREEIASVRLAVKV